MTKPKNFPGRLNQRRVEAVERLKRSPYPNKATTLLAIHNTEEKILNQDVAESIQTKKFRGRA